MSVLSVLSVLSNLSVPSVVKSSRYNLWFNLRYRDGITGVGAKDNCVSNYGYKLWTKTIYWKRRHYGRSPLHCTLYVSLSWPVGTMCTKYFQRSAGVHTVQPVECTVLKSFLISSSWFFHRLPPLLFNRPQPSLFFRCRASSFRLSWTASTRLRT